MIGDLKHFRFWCQKVLPLVYDDSLSYYEILCKVVDYLNKMRDDINSIADDWAELQKEIEQVKEWIDNFNTEAIEKIIKESILKMVIVNITDDGYIVIYIPESWDDIVFNTTGYDIAIEDRPDIDYGHLVISY